jgi:formate-dependent nitrite reductase membrane component NrfD
MVALGAAVAGYTAFLFGQCEGRDLWQTPLLLPTLLAQAAVAGSSAYALLDLVIDVPEQDAVVIVMLIGLGSLGGLIATELWSHPSRSVELAVLEMTKGAYAGRFWLGGVLAGIVIPLILAAIALASSGDATTALTALAGLSALIGLFSYEDAYVRAGQSVPLS